MKKFLIATILVLSCSTASADEVYIFWHDQVKDSPKTDHAWRSLVSSLEYYLKQEGHKVVESYSPLTQTQLAVMFLQKKVSGDITGAYYVLHEKGHLIGMGNLPLNGSSYDSSWMARKLIHENDLD